MAADTRDKRASLLGLGLASLLVLPLPAGSLDLGDRQHLAYLYRGVSTASSHEAVAAVVTVEADEIIKVDAVDAVIAVAVMPNIRVEPVDAIVTVAARQTITVEPRP